MDCTRDFNRCSEKTQLIKEKDIKTIQNTQKTKENPLFTKDNELKQNIITNIIIAGRPIYRETIDVHEIVGGNIWKRTFRIKSVRSQ